MKFNWGTGIFIFLAIFLALAFAFMYFAFSQDINLVHEDYYQRGVHHTEQMQINKRSVKYENQIKIENLDEQVSIEFSYDISSNLIAGKIFFFRPSGENMDIEYDIKLDEGKQLINKSDLKRGRYIVKITWNAEEKYHIEKEFFVE